VFNSKYCVDRLAIYVIDKWFTPATWRKWNEEFIALSQWERYEAKNMNALTVKSISHGITVFDALLRVGATYSTEVIKQCIRSGSMTTLTVLLGIRPPTRLDMFYLIYLVDEV
jgi:hypothetical protein